MDNKLKTICIIPARGGSKGLINKNLKKINNKPLIYYPIAAAIESNVCNKILVSTDSLEISKVAKKYGAEAPFLRESKFAKDRTTTEETLKEALKQAERYYNCSYDICVFLTANNIFRKSEWITKAVNILKNDKKIDSAFSVHKLYKHFWHKDKSGNLKKILPWMKEYTSRQIAPKLYREDTGIALASRAHLWRKGKRIGKKVKLIYNDFPFSELDIHDKYDLEIANNAMKLLKKNKKIKKIF